MPQPWSPRCCFEQHQKRMKRIRVNVDTEGLHTRWDARTNTRCTFFPKDNDTNKRAYIFQKTKRPKNSSSEILLWRLINGRTVRTSELLLFTGRSVQEFHFFHMKMCESISIYVREEKMQDGCFLLQLPACVRVCSVSLSVCRTRSLTQHSRPHTPDRLFSPILVEVLQREAEKKDRMRLRERAKKNSRLWGCWGLCIEPLEASPAETFCLSLSLPVSQSPGPQWPNSFTGCLAGLSLSPHIADISTHQIRAEQDPLGQRWVDE